eukprot:6480734-Prymnesium_polylepis.1
MGALLGILGPECDALAGSRSECCSAQWCYVDPNNCARPHEESAYFPDTRWNGMPLTYACKGGARPHCPAAPR